MQASDVLTVIAEIGVALAGFSGVVVALRQRSAAEWPLPEVIRLRLMLFASILTFISALLPFIPHHLGASPEMTWAVSSLALAAPLVLAVILSLTYARPSRTGLNPRWWIIYVSSFLITIALLLANISGVLGVPGAGLYLSAVAMVLLYATTLFVRLLLAPFSEAGASKR